MTDLISYKTYARLISIISAGIVILSLLDANQLINLFPAYTEQITFVFTVIGVIAPMIGQESRVTRAEEIQFHKASNNIQLSVDGVTIPNDIMNVENDFNDDSISINVLTDDVETIEDEDGGDTA